MEFIRKPRPWHWSYWRIKLIPLLLSAIVSVFLPVPLIFRVIAGTVLYVLLFCITWRKVDGTRAFPPYLW
jgi:hypothetical protein